MYVRCKKAGGEMKKISSLFFLAAFAAVTSGCNTIHGLGKDVEKVGEKVQQKSAR
jgi:entericidin A